jgi:hypothetical protein
MGRKAKTPAKAKRAAAAAKPTPTRRPADRDGWYALAETETIFGVAHRTFHSYYRPRIPEAGIRHQGSLVMIHLPTAIRAWVNHREDQVLKDAGGGADLDGDGEGLDRFRLARAQQEEMKLELMRKSHVPLAELNAALGQLAVYTGAAFGPCEAKGALLMRHGVAARGGQGAVDFEALQILQPGERHLIALLGLLRRHPALLDHAGIRAAARLVFAEHLVRDHGISDRGIARGVGGGGHAARSAFKRATS